MTIRQKTIVALLQEGTPTPQRPLFSRLFQETASGFLESTLHSENWEEPSRQQLLVSLVKYLTNQVYLQIDNIHRIRTLSAEFNKRVLKAATKEDKETLIIMLITDLGATPAEIRADKKALSRWLGRDTVLERCTTRIGASEYKIAFYLHCLASVAIKALATTHSESGLQRVWKQLRLEKLLETILGYVGDERLREAVFRCLADTLKILPQTVRSKAVKDSTVAFVYRSALDVHQQVWIQVQSLRLLAVLSDQSLERALRNRLEIPGDGDDIFVRKQAVLLIGEYLEPYGQLLNLLPKMITDPSPYVRQAIPQVLSRALTSGKGSDQHDQLFDLLHHLLLTEECHEVRAAALLILPKLIIQEQFTALVTKLLLHLLRVEKQSFVLRTGLKVFRETLLLLKETNQQQAAWFYEQLRAHLDHLHGTAEDLSVRRWTAQAINFAEVHLHRNMEILWKKLDAELSQLKLGKRKSLPKKWFKEINDEQLGQVLSLLAEESGGLTIDKRLFRYRISKGDRFDFCLWRFFHELCHPSPDKRQAYSHTTGRVYCGEIHAPTPIMAELTQTKVPGEPLLHSTEDGWRPYLPLVDQLLASLRGLFKGSSLHIFTAEGTTEIVPPTNPLKRYWARVVLTFSYSRYAALRNWQEKSGEQPSAYIRNLEKLGFQVTFSGYSLVGEKQTKEADSAVSRFFPFFPILFDTSLPGRIKDYVFSVYENSIYELGLFAVCLLLLFFGLRLSASIAVSRARNRLPMVIGGWGTRGKSGVERLKAALFESLGHGILSKSTGCEAMFLHSHQYGRTQEMFLFRPYDKATIWEHHSLIMMADKMKSSVFLWECMGLTPAYVDILQRKWSKDDFSTITNTYPDHEDIQGPAGHNIPQVMTCFIPDKGTLFTTEEQMHPILSENAISKKTHFHRIGWLEAGLLTPDILQRFPYEEHPYNIALVATLAEELGIAQDVALKEMADRVIPDLGVLKSFPKAKIQGRTLEFVNGMSANERFATLSNWQRMGFATESTTDITPGTFLHVVVNNRADRISRSRMFGSILAKDIIADRYIMIGSNLSGLLGYTMEAWDEYLSNIFSSLTDVKDPALFATSFQTVADNLRIPYKEEFLRQRFQLMLGPTVSDKEFEEFYAHSDNPGKNEDFIQQRSLPHSDALVEHVNQHLAYYVEYADFMTRLKTEKDGGPELLQALKELVTTWFKRRIVMVEDFHASGDMVINQLCINTPPGLSCRIMGVQNIKGTGLDFVYRWQAWERCWISCNKLRQEDETVFEEGLNEMMAFQDYGILCQEYVTDSLAMASQQSFTQTERCQAGLHLIQENLEKNIELLWAKMSSSKQSSGILGLVINTVEAFLDSGDAIKRRKIANTIYRDLTTERISHQRAALELQELNKRQKGGWLMKKLRRQS